MRSKSILAETPITITEATKIFPGRPHKSTLRRWCHRGYRGICLRYFYSGKTLCTTRTAIDEFLSAINPGSVPSPTSTAHKLAESRLDELGIF